MWDCYILTKLCHVSNAESEEDYEDLTEAVRLVKEVIAAVDSKVNEHEKRRRLKEFHCRMDSKSIMMLKSGQIFAREDLLRRRLIHDGALQLKNIQGRLKGEEMLHPLHLYVCKCWDFSAHFFDFCLSSRCPRSTPVRCLSLPPRERPEICLCHAGKFFLSHLPLMLHILMSFLAPFFSLPAVIKILYVLPESMLSYFPFPLLLLLALAALLTFPAVQ